MRNKLNEIEYNTLRKQGSMKMRFETISARELDNYVENEGFLIVDLREREEFDRGHIKGAIYIDYHDIANSQCSLSKDKVLILYCDRGGLSLTAARKLSVMGYRVASVVGGLRAYHGKNMIEQR